MNFGIHEPYVMYLIKSKEYALEDDDCACNDEFVLEDNDCRDLNIDFSLDWKWLSVGYMKYYKRY